MKHRCAPPPKVTLQAFDARCPTTQNRQIPYDDCRCFQPGKGGRMLSVEGDKGCEAINGTTSSVMLLPDGPSFLVRRPGGQDDCLRLPQTAKTPSYR